MKKNILLTTTLLLFLGLIGHSQNAFFEAYKLNESYKKGDYKTFFQLLANQPGLSQKLGIKKGEAIEYASVYSYYSSTSFLKITLDSMRNTQNRQLQKLNDTVATLQVRKTELVSSLNVLLQAEIGDYLIRIDSL